MSFDRSRPRHLLWAALALLGLGFVALILRGADQPADPFLAPPDSATAAPDLEPPGTPARVPLEGFDEIAVSIRPAGGEDWLAWCLLAAREAAQRSRGLMGVTDLQGYSGMTFLYDDDVSNGFYMRNTPTPLSIAWISADGEVVSTEDMEPCGDREDCPTYHPAGPYRTAIEVFQGDLDELGIGPGAQVIVGGACAPRS
ncbi:MAG: DUF192 domain-containing protein [Acidimicrobiales bacterium]